MHQKNTTKANLISVIRFMDLQCHFLNKQVYKSVYRRNSTTKITSKKSNILEISYKTQKSQSSLKTICNYISIMKSLLFFAGGGEMKFQIQNN